MYRGICSFPPWLGLTGVAIDHLDGAGNEDFPGIAGIKERIACAERDFRLVNFDDPFEEGAARSPGTCAGRLLCRKSKSRPTITLPVISLRRTLSRY